MPRSSFLSHNQYEYRFLEVLSKKHQVIVVFFTRLRSIDAKEKVGPGYAKLLLLRDFPFAERLPKLIRWPLYTTIRALMVVLLARTLEPDLVYGNWITRSSGLYCALAGVHPFIVAAWGDDLQVEPVRSRILRAFGKFTLRRADGVILDCEEQQKKALELGCDLKKIYSFPWGIDLNKFRPEKSTAIRKELGWLHDKIVISTRMHMAHYGIEYLIRAIPLILKRVKDVKFLIYGDGVLLEYHRSLARHLGIENQVKFVGVIPNDELPLALNAADLYVSTSLTDGSSASLMEALACGLPVVVTRLPANEEWITDGKNGFLVPPKDSVKLARYITRILQDGRLRSRMRNANIKLAGEKADWKINSLVLEKCVNDVLASHKVSNAGVSKQTKIIGA